MDADSGDCDALNRAIIAIVRKRREVEERRHGGGMRVTEKEKSKNLHPFGFCLHVLHSLSLLLASPLSFSSLSLPLASSSASHCLLLSVFLLGKSVPLCNYLGLTAATFVVV